jgi:hypothetical protein
VVAASTEAVRALDRALDKWSQQQRAYWTQAAAHVSATVQQITAERRQRLNRVSALAAALSAARDAQQANRIRVELEAARRLLQQAEAALARAGAAEQEFQAARRRAGFALEPAIDAARADLARRAQSLDAYATAGALSTPAPVVAGLGRAALGATALATAFTASGVETMSVDDLDFADNPIVGTFGRADASARDYRWAVETWASVVQPGLAAGLGRDDFEARDRERGAQPLRRTADVYDMFLTSPILVDRRPDGALVVRDGRHRVQMARELAITTLPVQVTR